MRLLLICGLAAVAYTTLAQSLPSPEFGNDVDIKTLLNDWSSRNGGGTVAPRAAQVNQAPTGRVVATWNVTGVPVPIWSGFFSPTNIAGAAARQDTYNERSALREIRTNTAASIDNVTFNITNDLQTTTSLTNGYSAADARSLINTLRRELIDQSQELKTALQQIQALRKYEADRLRLSNHTSN